MSTFGAENKQTIAAFSLDIWLKSRALAVIVPHRVVA
ncbi:hypothetical protein VISI1226_12751 [Vibrio sinaloensis DSM 21326]|uniref:Uncharacterized protein n=1 Tax=Vibrio sinaloensis DSM 21326 TaxID=945550 RepID=E8M2Z7_PHOS4|nr:hypothetical protein VISI1226_12751 [Vibrio sinaloensis DSM 21326]